VAGESAVGRIPGLVILQIRIGDGQQAAGLFLSLHIRCVDGDKMGRIVGRKRMKQDRIDQRKYSRGGSDSEGEGEDSKESEDRRSAQAAQAESHVAKDAAGGIVGVLFHHTGSRTFVESVCDQDWLRKVKICKRKARPEPG